MNLNSYSAYDFVIPNCLEPGDIIEWQEEIFTVKSFSYVSDGFIINAIDEYEEELELLIPDDVVLPLMEEQ